MFILKFMRMENGNGRVEAMDCVTCDKYRVIFDDDLITTRVSVADLEARAMGVYDLEKLYTIAPLADNPDDRVPYRFDVVYIENSTGKTIDKIAHNQ